MTRRMLPLHQKVLRISSLALLVAAVACHSDPIAQSKKYVESGDKYLAAGKLKEAIVEYKNAVQLNGQDGSARMKLAGAALRADDPQTALREYVRAADLLLGSADAQIKAGNMLLVASKFEDAQSRADKALAIAVTSEALMLKGNAMAGLKNLDEAIKQIQEAIRIDPDGSVAYYDLGALQFVRGDKAAAEQSFRRAVDVDPKSIPARLALANFLWASNRREEVLGVLNDALAINPKNVVVNRALAYLYVALNRPADAEAPLKVIAQESKDATARLVLADYYQSSHRTAEALAVLDALAAEPANYGVAQSKKAALLYATGKHQDAYAVLDETLKKQPANDTALLVKATLLLNDHRNDDALAAAKAARAAAPASPGAAFALGRIQAVRGEWTEATEAYLAALKLAPGLIPAQVELARTYLASGHPENAIKTAENALVAQRGNVQATLIKSRALLAMGNAVGAESTLKALPPQLTATSNVQTQLGLLYLLKQDLPNARKAFEAALTVEPTNVEALRGLTRLDFAAKNGAAAQTRIDGALARDPKSPGLLILSAQSNLSLGKKDEAERLLKLSIESDPQNLEAYSMLGRIYGTENRLDEAISQFEQLSAHKTTAVMSHTMIGMLLEMQKRPDAARQRYEQALSVDPNAGVAANNLAMILVQGGGNLDTALKLAQTAKSQLPNVGDVSDTLGLVYYRKGLATLAVGAFQDSVTKEPNNPSFIAHLGMAYAKAGELAKARESLQKAFSLSQDFADAAEAKATLASLGSKGN